jgi:hypothetical protein
MTITSADLDYFNHLLAFALSLVIALTVHGPNFVTLAGCTIMLTGTTPVVRNAMFAVFTLINKNKYTHTY